MGAAAAPPAPRSIAGRIYGGVAAVTAVDVAGRLAIAMCFWEVSERRCGHGYGWFEIVACATGRGEGWGWRGGRLSACNVLNLLLIEHYKFGGVRGDMVLLCPVPTRPFSSKFFENIIFFVFGHLAKHSFTFPAFRT